VAPKAAERAEGGVRPPRYTEAGDADELITRYGGVIRYSTQQRKWLAWEGRVWAEQDAGGVVCEYLKQIASELPDTKDAQKHQRTALSARGLAGALAVARTDPRITVEMPELDSHPWELNTPGGIVNLRTGQLGPHDPGRLHTKLTRATPDPTADRSRWLAFLRDTFGSGPEGEEMIGFVQRLLGYSAIGEVREHVLPFCLGGGQNGKGVTLETGVGVLGDYATKAPSNFLMAGLTRHETELARLVGKRLVIASEVNEGARFDEARVKELTGGDSITARFMRADHFTFKPSHTLWLMANTRPEVKSGGYSFWRRVREINFKFTVPENKRIDDLQSILINEHGPAVLSWIVDGAVAYAGQGLAEPASVKVATAEWSRDEDSVAQFLDERCLTGGGEHVLLPTAAVREAYEQFCHEVGVDPVSSRAFGWRLKQVGIGQKRSHGRRFYTGLALLRPDDEPPPGTGSHPPHTPPRPSRR
jgi:putative DNA primase/helicase